MFSASAYQPQAVQSDTPTILVIEDDMGNRLLTSKMLSSASYACRCAPTIEEGRKALQDGGIELVVSDLIFDDSPTAALALLADMRANAALAHIPVIIMTGKRSEETGRQVMAAGAAGIIIKPYPRENLITLVKQCLDKKLA